MTKGHLDQLQLRKFKELRISTPLHMSTNDHKNATGTDGRAANLCQQMGKLRHIKSFIMRINCHLDLASLFLQKK